MHRSREAGRNQMENHSSRPGDFKRYAAKPIRMSADDFKREWTAAGDTLIAFTPESLQSITLPDTSTDFLVKAGLPDSAAPFLDFHGHGTRRLQPASAAYSIGSEFERFRCIGTNDSGDPICIDSESNGAVVLLFHDDNFRVVLMNSSVEQLAESLLAFRKLVDATCELNGEDAFLDGDIPRHLIEILSEELATIDPDCVLERSFWSTELKSLQQMTA